MTATTPQTMEETGTVLFSHYWLHIHDKRNASYGDFLERIILPKLSTPMLQVFRSQNLSIRVLSHSFVSGRLIMALRVGRGERPTSTYFVPVTHVMIDPERRQVVIQETPSEVSGRDLASFLEFAATLFEPDAEAEVFLPPMLRKGEILEFIDSNVMSRIASVSLEIVRPNHGWTDYYNEFTSVADKSNASKVVVQMSAPKTSSLRQQEGIIAILRSLVAATPGLLQRFNVHAFLSGEPDVTVLDLHDHTIRTEEIIHLGADGIPDSQQIQRRLIEMKPSEAPKPYPETVPA